MISLFASSSSTIFSYMMVTIILITALNLWRFSSLLYFLMMAKQIYGFFAKLSIVDLIKL
jgi:hypothetical protein